MYFIGIDLAWTYKNPTGIVIINENKEIVFEEAEVFMNEDIIRIINQYQPNITSIDAPLVINNDKGGRACDSYLMKQKINNRYLKLYATSRDYMMRTFGDIRGEKIAVELRNMILHETLLETYPTGIFLSLFPKDFKSKYKISSKNDLVTLKCNGKRLLENISQLSFEKMMIPFDSITTKVGYKKYEDLMDGYLCAINSYYHYMKQTRKFLVDDNGCIVLPLLN